MISTLTIAKDTWFTLSKSQSTDLPDDQKHNVSAGEMLLLSSYERDADFYAVTLSNLTPVDGHSTWFVSVSDVRIEEDSALDQQSIEDDTTIVLPPPPAPKPKQKQ